MADDVLAALTGHPDFGKRVFWLTALDDQALLSLYRHAYASVLPSQYEGYGLPVVEALSQGCVTVASDAGSLPEVVAGHAVFFRRGDGEALHAILDRLYGDRDYYARLKRQPGASARHPGARQVGPSRRRSPTSPSFDRGMRNAWKPSRRGSLPSPRLCQPHAADRQ
jgi:glycosyltransferase involved in cell wall biosynthesis